MPTYSCIQRKTWPGSVGRGHAGSVSNGQGWESWVDLTRPGMASRTREWREDSERQCRARQDRVVLSCVGQGQAGLPMTVGQDRAGYSCKTGHAVSGGAGQGSARQSATGQRPTGVAGSGRTGQNREGP